jgi:hypothetical protein
MDKHRVTGTSLVNEPGLNRGDNVGPSGLIVQEHLNVIRLKAESGNEDLLHEAYIVLAASEIPPISASDIVVNADQKSPSLLSLYGGAPQ